MRTGFENRPGQVFDPEDKQRLYSEDANAISEAVNNLYLTPSFELLSNDYGLLRINIDFGIARVVYFNIWLSPTQNGNLDSCGMSTVQSITGIRLASDNPSIVAPSLTGSNGETEIDLDSLSSNTDCYLFVEINGKIFNSGNLRWTE